MDKKQRRPIRVLEVFGKMNRGGAEAMIMNLYRNMDRSLVQMDFMVHTEEPCQFDNEIERLGGRIFRVPRFKVYNILSYWRAWRAFFKQHPEIHVVHGHIGSSAAIYLHIANRVGCYTIAHSHSAGAPRHSLHDYMYSIFSWPTRYVAKQMFGCSTEAGIARFGKKVVQTTRYQNFPNAIELDDFNFNPDVRESVRKELGISQQQSVVINVGRISIPKNPSKLLEIFEAIVKQDGSSVCLWVGTGELENVYIKKIKDAKLEDRVRMLGVRRDIAGLLMASDVFLFPSLWEGLPVSVIEAQATGLPCILADTISKETQVSQLVEWHSLNESASVWATRCLSMAKRVMVSRKSPRRELSSAGYDIKNSSKMLQEYYIKRHNAQ